MADSPGWIWGSPNRRASPNAKMFPPDVSIQYPLRRRWGSLSEAVPGVVAGGFTAIEGGFGGGKVVGGKLEVDVGLGADVGVERDVEVEVDGGLDVVGDPLRSSGGTPAGSLAV